MVHGIRFSVHLQLLLQEFLNAIGAGPMFIVTTLSKHHKSSVFNRGSARNAGTFGIVRMVSPLSATQEALVDCQTKIRHRASIPMKTRDSERMVVIGKLRRSESCRRRPPQSFFAFRNAFRVISGASPPLTASCFRMAPIMLTVVCSCCPQKSQHIL